MDYRNQAQAQANYKECAPSGLSQYIGGGVATKPASPESAANKLRELDAALAEIFGQARILANSLAGCEPEDPRCEPPTGSDLLSQLDSLRRTSRDINHQLVRANQAVGN